MLSCHVKNQTRLLSKLWLGSYVLSNAKWFCLRQILISLSPQPMNFMDYSFQYGSFAFRFSVIFFFKVQILMFFFLFLGLRFCRWNIYLVHFLKERGHIPTQHKNQCSSVQLKTPCVRRRIFQFWSRLRFFCNFLLIISCNYEIDRYIIN